MKSECRVPGNAVFRLLDHEIGAAVQPAELGPFFGTIFPALREPKTWPCGTLSQLFVRWTSCLLNLDGSTLGNLKYPEETGTPM